METMLKNLFDYQRFANNRDLEAVADSVESRYSNELSDDLLEYAAAGVKRSEEDINLEEVLGIKENGD